METEKSFTSARLVYRALEADSPEDDQLLLTIARDVTGYANSNGSVLKPQSKKDANKWKDYLLETPILTVVICLPAATSSAANTTSSSSDLTPIGVISLGHTSPNMMHHRHADISVDIIPSHQRKGYGSEAINWIVNWGFQIQGLHRIGIESVSFNEGAGRLYEKLGFVFEGRKRDIHWFNGRWHDLLSFAMLEDEWREAERKKGRQF